MKNRQVNLRLESGLIAAIEAAAEVELLDRGSLIRKLLLEALSEWRLKHALKRYQTGEISIGRASEDTGRSHWEMMDLIRAHGIVRRIDIEDSLARARQLMSKRAARVAEGALPYQTGAARPARAAARAPRPRRRAQSSGDETLADFRPRPGGILLVGINPAPPSVARGHYYQGKLGRRLWKRLGSLGLLRDAIPGHEDEAFLAAGHGLSDVVKRPTRSARDLEKHELAEGTKLLRRKVREWQPKLVLFAFKGAAVAALGRGQVKSGPCGAIEGVPAFLLSGPYARASDAEANDRQLRGLL